jgi:hypothetical protein
MAHGLVWPEKDTVMAHLRTETATTKEEYNGDTSKRTSTRWRASQQSREALLKSKE